MSDDKGAASLEERIAAEKAGYERYCALIASAAQYRIPDYMREGIVRYIVYHIECGSFLDALLSNDLRAACEYADETNRHLIWDYCNFLYNCAPASCWGSPEKVRRWLAGREAA
jgi:hypothetical protein